MTGVLIVGVLVLALLAWSLYTTLRYCRPGSYGWNAALRYLRRGEASVPNLVARAKDDGVRLSRSSLYVALARMVDHGLVVMHKRVGEDGITRHTYALAPEVKAPPPAVR